tara:strand:- start:6198 stop:6614 length:417 start_codon:yes stop_codon:yes gene_type:complete
MKFLLFIIFLPIIEIYFFVKIGSEIGPISTIVFTLLTAFLGAATIKYQGITSFMQARQSIFNTSEPGIEIFSNLILLICGIFLLIPGFFTDFLGILLLIPPLRVILIRIALKNAIINFQNRRKSKKENNDYIDIDPDN